MHIKKGKDRFVLVFPALGIVFKFPVIRLNDVLKRIVRDSRDNSWKALRGYYFKWNPNSPFNASGKIFKGILANIRERRLWKSTQSDFLVPTFFSACGLLNIQKYSRPHGGEYLDLWIQIRKITNEEAYSNPHQFSEVGNYSLVDGKLRMIDYGGYGSEKVVTKYGQLILEKFDPNFRYEARNTGS